MDSITKIELNENVGFINQITTNKKTLINIISFVYETNARHYSTQTHYTEYGCYNVALYERKLLLKSYNLNRPESQQYFHSLIEMLKAKRLDPELIKKMTEQGLGPVSY